MPNQRIDILLDELRQRYEEIDSFNFPKNDGWDLNGNKKDDFLEILAEYVYFILITPELNEPFVKIIQWPHNKANSPEVKGYLVQAATNIKQIGIELSKYREQLPKVNFDGRRDWMSPYPPLRRVSCEELINLLNQDQSIEDPIDTIEMVLDSLRGGSIPQNGILFYMKQVGPKIDDAVKPYLRELDLLRKKLRAALIFEPSFVGHREANEILQAFKFKYPDIEIELEEKESAFFKYDALRKEDVEYIRNASRKIFKILSRALSANRLRTYTMFRLKSYMEWFYKPQRGRTHKWSENELTNEMAKFLFSQGFFPFIRFKMGRSEPDMFGLSAHEEILIEAKKYLKKEKLSSKKMIQHISQAIQYYHKLRSVNQGIENQIYLVTFYNGDCYPICDGSVIRDGVVVNILFIYLGDKTPHEKRKDLILSIGDFAESSRRKQ